MLSPRIETEADILMMEKLTQEYLLSGKVSPMMSTYIRILTGLERDSETLPELLACSDREEQDAEVSCGQTVHPSCREDELSRLKLELIQDAKNIRLLQMKIAKRKQDSENLAGLDVASEIFRALVACDDDKEEQEEGVPSNPTLHPTCSGDELSRLRLEHIRDAKQIQLLKSKIANDELVARYEKKVDRMLIETLNEKIGNVEERKDKLTRRQSELDEEQEELEQALLEAEGEWGLLLGQVNLVAVQQNLIEQATGRIELLGYSHTDSTTNGKKKRKRKLGKKGKATRKTKKVKSVVVAQNGRSSVFTDTPSDQEEGADKQDVDGLEPLGQSKKHKTTDGKKKKRKG